MQLSHNAVEDILKFAVLKEGEFEISVIVEGLVNSYAFHPERIKIAKPRIDELLLELPENFQRLVGGGWSFLNACEDKHGRLWTGMHLDVERLICLGIAVGSASWLMKNYADKLPGGMPYFEVHPED